MDEMRGGLRSKYIEVDHFQTECYLAWHLQTRLSAAMCICDSIPSSIRVMPLCFSAGVGLECSKLGIITKGTTRLQNVNTLTRCLDRAISRHRKVGSQIAKVLGPGWRLKDNENMHVSWTWD